ncbi:MAG: aminotransferase class I/II-fold pyridoxal phosphate-dependent enzyme, partial [Flavobacteriales bacterium]|nr:aminotransferase class I/II-fold pyridoxal phosphate-dependent enzyme [Flavobacteriales bacterium]
MNVEQTLSDKLENRKGENALRSLKTVNGLIDFSSNDYLGFARDFAVLNHSVGVGGSTGSRLLTGNSIEAEELEAFIAEYHNAEAGLLYNSGYDANIGLLSCVPQRGDTVIYDELSHASIIDGIRLSRAESFKFKHNNLEHLETRLKSAKGNVFVVVESVYSMDGDFSPLQELINLKQKFDFNLIVDEAHATGLFGKKGEGRCVELGIQNEVFARVHTYGKALGCHGAIVLGSETLRSYLINFSRSFIYTTALPIS